MRVRGSWIGLIALATACGGGTGASLSVTVRQGTVDAITAKASATNGDGTVGKGNVTLTSSAGSLSAGATLPLDEFGTASTTFTCDPVAEPKCSPKVTVTGTWKTASGEEADALGSYTLTGTPTGDDAGIPGFQIMNRPCSKTELDQDRFGIAGVCCHSGTGSSIARCGSTAQVQPGARFPLHFGYPADAGTYSTTWTAVGPPNFTASCSSGMLGFSEQQPAPGAGYFEAKRFIDGTIYSDGTWIVNEQILNDSTPMGISGLLCATKIPSVPVGYFAFWDQINNGLNAPLTPAPGEPDSLLMVVHD